MNPNVLLILQALCWFGQSVNAGLAASHVAMSPVMVVLISSAVGTLQLLLQQIGNNTVPKKTS